MDESFPRPVKKLGLCPAVQPWGATGAGGGMVRSVIWKVHSGCCEDSGSGAGAWSTMASEEVARGVEERGWADYAHFLGE